MEELVKEALTRLGRIEAAVAPPAREYLDTDAAAEFTTISRPQLEEWRSRGGGPRFIKMGRKVIYRVADLRAFVEAGGREALR